MWPHSFLNQDFIKTYPANEKKKKKPYLFKAMITWIQINLKLTQQPVATSSPASKTLTHYTLKNVVGKTQVKQSLPSNHFHRPPAKHLPWGYHKINGRLNPLQSSFRQLYCSHPLRQTRWQCCTLRHQHWQRPRAPHPGELEYIPC